jgi:transcription elongation GreA/GreB family factor
MSSTSHEHEMLRSLLAESRGDEAQAFWLELADQHPDQPEFLLLLVKEFADAGQADAAAELASLIAPGLKSAAKDREWLYALKLQAHAKHPDKALRAELAEAYQAIHAADNRLRPILAVAELDQSRTPLLAVIAKIDTLLALNAGGYCQHKNWGVGRIKTFDATLNRIVVAFPHNPDHAMQLAYAADSLTPLNADHIEVRKLTGLDSLKQLAATDPVGLIRIVLVSYRHSVSPDRLETILTGTVIAPADWKKWWDNAKKLLKRDSHFEVPAKKTEPIALRSAPVSQQDELLEAFRVAPSLAQRTEVARQLLKILDSIADPGLLVQEFQDGLLESFQKTKSTRYADRLEAAFVLEDLHAENAAALVTGTLAGIRYPPAVFEELSPASAKRAIVALGDRLLPHVNDLPAKILENIADLLPQARGRIAQLVQNKSAGAELLLWLCRNVTALDWLAPLQSPVLLQAVLSALETSSAKNIRRLRDVLFDEETLLVDLLANAGTDVVRDVSRQILANPGLDELDRRSLMARLVKEFPFVQEFLITKTVREQPLMVSWASLHKRRAELDEIITKRIPENSKEIGVARSYGDLRENFEFKAAKELQKVLMRRRAELEILLSRAQATDFADTKTDVVSIGTSVTITDLGTNQPQTYHILGAWDSDTARGIISYPAALAQALLNKRIGEVLEASGETGKLKYRIDHIEKVPAAILQSL